MNKRDNPCLGCENSGRGNQAGCGNHSKCEKYLAYRKKREEQRNKWHLDQEIGVYIREQVKKSKTSKSKDWSAYRNKEGDNKK